MLCNLVYTRNSGIIKKIRNCSFREQMDKGEVKPTFSDLLPVSVALEKAERQATCASEGQEPQPERRVVTQQDYDDTLAAAKARMAELKKKEGAEAVG